MRAVYTVRFLKSYAAAPLPVQRAVGRRVALLLQSLHYPSLHAKKYDEAHDIWQARVNRGWRFYFRIQNSIYQLVDLTPHPK